MAGLYVHIPFCKSKCAYCDFFSIPLDAVGKHGLSGNVGMSDIYERYCEALIKEFDLRHNEISEPFTTIYIGGGTPTALDLPLLSSLLESLIGRVMHHNSSLASSPSEETAPQAIEEFTVEANPEDISLRMITALRHIGVNRISIGIQAFDNRQLDTIQRRHDATSSLHALEALRASGINYSADLIYGLPDEDADSWRVQLERLMEFRPPHFSAYLLSYEPGTRLYVKKGRGEVTEASEQDAEYMYRILTETARRYGYNHYEISNFALPGKEAVHNSSYWNLTPYLGLGCSAHSFDSINRRVNPLSLKRYIAAIERQISHYDLSRPVPSTGTADINVRNNINDPDIAVIEEENDINRLNDYIITSLRTSKGLSLSLIKNRWGKEAAEAVANNIRPLAAAGKLIDISQNSHQSIGPDSNISHENIIHDTYLRIPESRWLTSDAILRELILDPE